MSKPKGRTPPDAAEIPIHIASGYGGNTKRPFVELTFGPVKTTMSTAKAREIALLLLESADAAESDGFLVEFMQTVMDGDARAATAVLMRFRAYRAKLRGEGVDAA